MCETKYQAPAGRSFDDDVRIHDLNWMQLEDYLERDDRIVLPLGSTKPGAKVRTRQAAGKPAR